MMMTCLMGVAVLLSGEASAAGAEAAKLDTEKSVAVAHATIPVRQFPTVFRVISFLQD
jgi:hypothetical protein